MGSFKEFVTRPRYFRQHGSFPLYITFRTNGRYNERFWPAQIQGITLGACAATFVSGLMALLQHATRSTWVDICLMVGCVLAVTVQQIYYFRKGQHYFQLYRAQFREDKETIAYLKRNHFG